MFNVCYLVKVNTEFDDIGQPINTEEKVKIFCEVGSITRAEWNAAAVNGFKPSIRLTVNAFEYDGELDIEFNGKRYSVYRTYTEMESNKTELYLELKVGDDNGN